MAGLCEPTPRPSDQFMQFYVVGPNQSLADYFPGNNPNIRIGESISWYLSVTNNMDSVQPVSIRLKISNQTILPPNDTLALPSPVTVVTDFTLPTEQRDLDDIFCLECYERDDRGRSTHIFTLKVNNESSPISTWSARGGYNFRLIFELWVWEPNNGFQFGWYTNRGQHTAWLQVWFNMTKPGPVSALP